MPVTNGTKTQAYMQKAKGLSGVYCVALNRPDVKNALSKQLLEDLDKAVAFVASNTATRVLIIHSSTPGSFCAGADLKERRTMSNEDVVQFLNDLTDLFNRIAKLTVPTIAAIDGPALGGGLELALACDIRIVAHDVDKISLPECRIGIIPGAGGTQRLPRLIGASRAKELIFTGRSLNAQQALDWGVVDHIAEPGTSALDKACALAGEMQGCAPLALTAAKEAIMKGLAEETVEAGLVHERSCYQRLLGTRDRMEALEAFCQKRRPVFKGE
ncbi:ClpP/crotonase [Thelephora ganbajun]|uniref:ClpP/crotonase n=1 Tax=Thelephora ganbajun TaxID=370292 RepID=A0ACB6ZJC7_THEGA|nr:ClpP/crotonase [Thelephora ganbajun]